MCVFRTSPIFLENCFDFFQVMSRNEQFGRPFDLIEEEARGGYYEYSARPRIGYFPFLYTIVSLVVIFGIGLLILQLAGETTTWAIAVVLVVFIILGIWVYSHEIKFTLAYVRREVVGISALYQFFDVVFAAFLVAAAIWFIIYILDNSQFLRVPDGSPYRKFVTFWYASVSISATTGFSITVPVGIFAELWGIVMAINVVWLFFAVFSNGVTKRLYMKHENRENAFLAPELVIDDQLNMNRGESVGGVRVTERKGKRRGKKYEKQSRKQAQGRRKPVNNPMRLVQLPDGKWSPQDSEPSAPSIFVNSKKKK